MLVALLLPAAPAGAGDPEPLHRAIAARLDALLAPWAAGEPRAAGDLAPLLAPGFSCAPLLPEGIAERHTGPAFAVERWTAGGDDPVEQRRRAGAPGLAQELRRLRDGIGAVSGLRLKTKVDRIHVHGDEVRARVLLRARAPTAAGLAQWIATWTCRWTLPGGAGDAPRLRAVDVSACTIVRRRGDGDALFEEITGAVLAGGTPFQTQLLPGLGAWQGRLASGLGFSHLSHQGVAVGDVNGDGLEDLFLPQPGGLPNLLLLRRADGTLEDVSAAAGVDFLDAARCGLLVDFDGDDDLDLVVNLVSELVFLSNDGTGRFRVETTGHAPESTMLAAADYDGDGRVDVYACRYLNPYSGDAFPLPYHDANNGLENMLLRNAGDWRFEDVTVESGMDVNNRRFSFAAAWEDYDNDGDQDLYVSNDFGRNNLYRNDGGRFTDVAAAAGVEDVSAGMGVTWADVDRDGWMDLYVSNMQSGAGGRITGRRGFLAGADAATREQFRRHARGNSLFRNRGDGSFEDLSERSGTQRGLWAWGALFADLDNDAREDLVVPNGFITGERLDDL